MISAETASFMKWGGLGMIATELPEAFNQSYCSKGECLTVVTPMYLGNTGKKKAELKDGMYYGAEHKSIFCYENGEELTVENVKKYILGVKD